MSVSIKRKLSSAHRAVFRRADGSVRGASIKENGKSEFAWFSPGAELGDDFEVIKGKRVWHWASSMTDEELAKPGNHFGEGYTGEALQSLRTEAAQADAEQRFVDFEPRKVA